MTTWRPFPDPYRTLGVSNDATLEEIRLAHRDLVLQHHPDRFPGAEGKFTATRKFQTIQDAYNTLQDPEAREKYDLVRLWGLDQIKESPSQTQPLANSNVSQLDKARPGGVLVARGYINGQGVNAIPDTGASCNIVSYSYASRLGFKQPQRDCLDDQQLRMANGKLLRTIGTLRATWQFSTDPESSWNVVFHVLEDFIYDLVLGNEFLRATKTMAQNKKRLSRVPRPLRALAVLLVNNLGPVNQRLLGMMNGALVEALPDSGSEPNLVSLEYAIRQGWRDRIDGTDVRLLQFADGAVERTMGSLAVMWKFRTAQGGGSLEGGVTVLFHILYGCVYDAILGEDVLTETDAFSKHEESFIDIDDAAPGPPGLNLVIWLPAKDKVKPTDQRISRPRRKSPPSPASGSSSPRSPVSTGLQRRGAIRRRDSSDEPWASQHLHDPDDLMGRLERRAAAEREARLNRPRPNVATLAPPPERPHPSHAPVVPLPTRPIPQPPLFDPAAPIEETGSDSLSHTDSSEGVDKDSRNTSSSTDMTDPDTHTSTVVDENSSTYHDSTLVTSLGNNAVGKADDGLGVGPDTGKAPGKDVKPERKPKTTWGLVRGRIKNIFRSRSRYS